MQVTVKNGFDDLWDSAYLKNSIRTFFVVATHFFLSWRIFNSLFKNDRLFLIVHPIRWRFLSTKGSSLTECHSVKSINCSYFHCKDCRLCDNYRSTSLH